MSSPENLTPHLWRGTPYGRLLVIRLLPKSLFESRIRPVAAQTAAGHFCCSNRLFVSMCSFLLGKVLVVKNKKPRLLRGKRGLGNRVV